MQVRAFLFGVVLLLGTALPAHPQSPEEKEALRAQARQLLIEARELAQNAKNPQKGAVTLMNIAGTFVLIGDFSRAHETARLLQSQKEVDMALDSIARSQAQQGDLNAALQTLGLISSEHGADMLLHTLVFTYVDKGEAAEAVALVNRIRSPSRRAIAMAQVATAKKTGGRPFPTLETALNLAGSIADPRERLSALTGVANAQYGSGDQEGAKHTLSLARPLLAAAGASPPGRNLTQVLSLTNAYAGIGDVASVTEFLDLLQRSVSQGMGLFVDRALIRAAERLAIAGETAGARALAGRASNPESAELVLVHAALGRAGQGDLALALEILPSLTFPYPKLILLQAIGMEERFQGKATESSAAFRDSTQLVAGLKDERCKQSAGVELAVNLARSGEYAMASEVIGKVEYGSDPAGWLWMFQATYGNWQEVLEQGRKLSDTGDKAMALATVADGLALRAMGHRLTTQRARPQFSSLSDCMPR